MTQTHQHDTNPSISYRYPGSRPFSDSELDRRLFFGREDEIQYLFHSILVETLFVLFAKSGMGKTSLLNAGVMELLRQENFLPLPIRFNDRESTPLDLIYPGIEEAIKQWNKKVEPGEKIDYEPGEKETLWQYFNTAAFWSSDDKPLIPILIFDQFEEFFTMHSREEREVFLVQLADLVRGRVPAAVRNAFKAKEHFPYSDTAPEVKIIISIREDYLGHLEEMSEAIPNILKNRFRLLPLKSGQAKDAIVKPAALSEDEHVKSKGFLYADETIDEMLDFLCKRRERGESVKTDEVEPFQLQLLCQHIEEKVNAEADKETGEYIVQPEDLGGRTGMNRVMQGFYENRIKTLDSVWKRIRVRKLCEKGLIDNKYRLSLEGGYIRRKYRVPGELLSHLVDYRLLRSEPRVGSFYYELSHDTLVEPILKSSRQRKAKKTRLGAAFLLVFILIFAAVTLYEQSNQVDKLSRKADELKQRNKYEEAIEVYSSIIEIDKKNINHYIKEIGGLSRRIKSFDTSIDFYKKALEINPQLYEVHTTLGDIYKQKGDFNEAEEEYEKALEALKREVKTADGPEKDLRQPIAPGEESETADIKNKMAHAYTGLALLHIKREKIDEAVNVYQDAVESNPDLTNIYSDIARAMKKKNMRDGLEKLLILAIEAESDKAKYYENLGRDFNLLKIYDGAIESYKKALTCEDKKASTYKGLAISYIDRKEPGEAIDVYRDAVKDDTGYASIFRDIAWTIKKRGMERELETFYKTAFEIDLEKAVNYEKLGTAFISLKEYERAIESYIKALTYKDKNASAYKGLAIAYIYKQEPGKAVEVFQDAVTASHDFANIYRDISREMKKRKWRVGLEALLKIAFKVNSDKAKYYENLGRDFNHLKLYNRAIDSYKKALACGDKNASTYKGLAIAYIDIKKPGKAIDVYRDAVKENTDYVSIFRDITWTIKKRGMERELETFYTTAFEIDLKKAVNYEKLGTAFISLKEYNRAIDSYKKALTFKDKNASTYKGLAIAYIYKKEPGKAVEAFRDAVTASHDFAVIYRDIALAMMRRRMVHDLEKLSQIASEIKINDSTYYKTLGYFYHSLRKYNLAAKNCEKALELGDTKSSTYKGLAIAYIEQGKPDKAISVYRDAVKVKVDFYDIYIDIAREMKNKGMEHSAKKLEQIASEFEPKDPEYHIKYGNRYFASRGYDKAVEYYKNALRLGAKSFTLYKNLGYAWVRLKRYNEAAENYKKALKIKKDDISTKADIAELELIIGNFSNAFVLANELLESKKLSTVQDLGMRFTLVSSLVFQQKKSQAYAALEKLVKRIPESGSLRGWTYRFAKDFIAETNELKKEDRNLLLDLIAILESSKDRYKRLKAFEEKYLTR